MGYIFEVQHECRLPAFSGGTMRARTGCLVLGTLLLTSAAAFAQDAHYSTMQYGPRASLLGGAVIGSVDDVSGTYYNPGALVLARDLAFAFSTNVFEVQSFRLEDTSGAGIDLGSSRSGIRPSLIAGTIKRGLFGGRALLAYSALTRMRGSQELEGQFVLGPGELPDTVGIRDLTGQAVFEGTYSDTWGGITYSHLLGSSFGIGVTWYGGVRSQKRRITTNTAAVFSDTAGGNAFETVSGRLNTFRMLLKFGAFAETGPFTVGATFTTPSAQLFGGGERSSTSSFNSPDSLFVAANSQTEIDATYKSPMSIGFGLGWRIGNGVLHASAEYFDEVAPYRVLDVEPFQAIQPDDVTVSPNPVHSAKDVLNWAIGGEYEFTPGLKGYMSFFTDDSALVDDQTQSALSAVPVDISTITAGVKFTVSSALFTIGGGYGWGSKVDDQLTGLLPDEEADLEAKYVYSNFRVLFGFEIGVD
jgi:hypothetical protein